MADESKLGDALKRRRQEQKLTLEQLSEKSGVSRAAISKIERGDSSASTPVLGRLAEALDLSISQLIGGRRGEPVLHVPRMGQPVFTEESTGFERRSLSPMYLGRGIGSECANCRRVFRAFSRACSGGDASASLTALGAWPGVTANALAAVTAMPSLAAAAA